jgi:hypothetical protein
VESGIASSVFRFGRVVVVMALALLILVVGGVIALVFGGIRVPPESAGIAMAAFGVIGTAIGFVNGYASNIVNYYFGASKSGDERSDKQTEQIAETARTLGEAAAAAPRPPPPAPPPAPPSVIVVPSTPNIPVPPQAPLQRAFPDGSGWRTTPDGIVVEGEEVPMRTVGLPVTVRRIWTDFGREIARACAVHGVPLEIAVACAAVESRGQPRAVRNEPDGRASSGLFQTLTQTASEMLGREVSVEDLLDPALSAEAGIRYLAKQYPKTEFQAPKVAAAYNAGGIYHSAANRWKMRSTGDHIDRFCMFMGDACFVAKEDAWGKQAAEWATQRN